MEILRRIHRQQALAERGFTLLELVVVLAILSIMLAITAPELSQALAKARLEGAAYQLHSDLRLAQQTAKREQCPVVLSLYPEGKSRSRYDIRLQPSESVEDIVVVKQGTLARGIQVDYTGDTSVYFAADGHIMDNGHITLSQGQRRRYLYFYQTGRVRISAQKN